MKAALVRSWGEVPVYTEVPDPEPDGGYVVAAVEACGLTNLTKALVSGHHYASKALTLPVVPGMDGVARLADGRRVYAAEIGPPGFLAERTLLNPESALPVPDHVDSVLAAALPNAGVPAWQALGYSAQLSPGAHLLVLGATGVTGALAVQLAKQVFGAEQVVVAGRDTARLNWLRDHGADVAITLGVDDLGARVRDLHAARPFDAVLDFLWSEPAEQVLAALADVDSRSFFHSTRVVQFGAMAGPNMTLPAGILRSSGITLCGVGFGSIPPEVVDRIRAEALPRMFDMAATGDLSVTTAVRPLADVAQVWNAHAPSGTRVVLTP